jgi:hypothetical protein
MQRLRQLEPSWFRRGQTTSLLASVIEKDEVREDRGGILSLAPPCAGGSDLEARGRGGIYEVRRGVTAVVGGFRLSISAGDEL